MSKSKVLPYYELHSQCRDIVNMLPLENWDDQPDKIKMAAGLCARWIIENAFRAALLSRGKELPKSMSLVDYREASQISLNAPQETLLKIVDTEVTCREPAQHEGYGRYYDCCRLAIGVVSQVGDFLVLEDLFKRKRDRHK